MGKGEWEKMKAMTLREVQLAELNILRCFANFCEEHGLRYYLANGTLLGAIRHKGFIPWDDDIDVVMPRKDYEKFKKLYIVNENCPYELWQDGYPFVKMMDSNIYFKPLSDTDIDEKCNLWLDIFPYDGFPSDVCEAEKLINKMDFLRKVHGYSCKRIFNGKSTSEKAINFFKKVITFKLLWILLARLIGTKRIAKWIDIQAKKIDFETADFVGSVAFGIYGMGERISKEHVIDTVKVIFEGQEFPAFKGWDAFLTGIYGDYMVEKRHSHEFEAFYR